jgi:hypothetical protein
MRRMTSRGVEVLSRGFVGDLGELADQLLEDRTHLCVADGVGVEIDASELFGDLIEHAALGETVYLSVDVEAFEDVPHRREKDWM